MSLFVAPPVVSPDQSFELMRREGFAVLSADGVAQALSDEVWTTARLQTELNELSHSWGHLVRDAYLKDGGRYRLRRHASFVVHADMVTQAPHRAHFQPVEYNALHGGMYRWFEPMQAVVTEHPLWQHLLRCTAQWCSRVQGAPEANVADEWFIEAHQFRIDTTDGIGRPTPEGAHRDGVDFVMVFLLDRVGIKGGETRVFEADGPNGQRFTLTEPWSLLWMDDAKVIHESTPIQPMAEHGHRDTLVLTFRRVGFLGNE